MLGDARFMERVRQENPRLAEAAPDPARFRAAWQEEQRRVRTQQEAWEREQALLEADPFNVEAQQRIERLIQQQQIANNLEKAMEENPECMWTRDIF
jgi:DNA damage-inducible protein 1